MSVFSRAQYLLLNLRRACLLGSISTRARNHVRAATGPLAEITRHDSGRSDCRLSAAIDAACAQQSSDRTRAAGSMRRRNAWRRRHSGEIARRVSPDQAAEQASGQSIALFLRPTGTAADRRRARTRQFRPDTARLAGCDLAMDQPGSVADDDARLCLSLIHI